jgi:preprotein translocase subunit SecE
MPARELLECGLAPARCWRGFIPFAECREMTNQRLAGLTYAAFAWVIALFLGHLLGDIGVNFLKQPVIGEDFLWADAIGWVLAIGAAVVCWRTPRIWDSSLAIADELRRVTWPSFPEVRASTFAVIVATTVAAVVLGLFDTVWQFLSDKLYTPPV